MLTVAEKIRLTLESLGSTSAEVAQSLSDRGITGRRDSGCDCPVARLLQAEVPETVGQWSAGQPGYWLTRRYLETHDPNVDIDIPDPVSDFIRYFDNGAYRHLDSEVTS